MKFKSRWRWIKKIRLRIDSTNSSIYRTNEWNSGRKRNTYTDDNWMTSIKVENKWFNTRMIYLKSGKKEQVRSYLEGETERIQCWYWNVNKPINLIDSFHQWKIVEKIQQNQCRMSEKTRKYSEKRSNSFFFSSWLIRRHEKQNDCIRHMENIHPHHHETDHISIAS